MPFPFLVGLDLANCDGGKVRFLTVTVGREGKISQEKVRSRDELPKKSARPAGGLGAYP
jgi:hypothetical protein